MATKKQTLAEVIQDSIRRSDVSAWRNQIEKTLKDPDRDAAICELASMPLFPMVGRATEIQERVINAGGDWYKILDDYDNPQSRALAEATAKMDNDIAAAWGAWKRACMRRRPEQD